MSYAPRMRRIALLLMILIPALAACPPPKSPALSPVAKDTRLLVIPLVDAALTPATQALARLDKRAAAGEQDAAWARLHYLIDLFDDARFRRDDASLRFLHQALKYADDQPMRGTEATDRVLTGILKDVDELLGVDRLHPHAQGARTLLEFDSRPPRTRVGLLTRIAELKSIVSRNHALADNARLRLFGYCRNAFQDIPAAKYVQRPQVLAHCLYPLYNANPEPYFARLPEDRPPTPRWRDVHEQLLTLVDAIGSGGGRLSTAARYLEDDAIEFVNKFGESMPALPEIDTLKVPKASRVAPYDWTPLYVLGRGDDRSVLANIDALARTIAGDGRRTATVTLHADIPVDTLVQTAQTLARAGVETLEIGVRMTQFLKVPRGDYWYRRIEGEDVDRLGVLPVSLGTLSHKPSERSHRWDPTRSSLSLYLVVSDTHWTLTSPTGQVASVPYDGHEHAQQTLRGVLSWLYRAFPEEDALVVVPTQGATIKGLVHALEASRHDEQGRVLMSQIGLGKRAPAVAGNTLADRVQRRSQATVEIQPQALGTRAPVLRACYQRVLDIQPKAKGEFRLELSGADVSVVRGPKDAALRACLMSSVAPLMKQQGMASAEVRLSAE